MLRYKEVRFTHSGHTHWQWMQSNESMQAITLSLRYFRGWLWRMVDTMATGMLSSNNEDYLIQCEKD
eukprot:95466-Hanusia_phi.AAC.9